ncbi:MAG: acyl-CoA dehydrogenase family protein [Phenylobacterium sp.]|uniref:acyl-CoA dehydrogenase family protein n=1 Tax=Phenylobacterium sp. TaxID=1871053 RepID=UPI0027350644|nr:acyl-CoA dehydrogenase family protein [Phenylobacterium sp.]MDP3174640.1 acyl-CoA dehydrogenase family protein [Phenylobacterium sp.]
MLQSERMMILERQAKPTARDLVPSLKAIGRLNEPGVRDEAARLYIEGEMIRLMNLRAMSDQLNAKRPGPEAAAIKMIGAPHDQRLLDFAKKLQGQAGMVAGESPFPGLEASFGEATWDACFWDSPTLTLRAGSQELMRNVIGERVLGLPRELDPSAKGDWTENLRALGKAA